MKKSGFIYLWFDRLKKMYYIGCHWGHTHDGYVCSSAWMKRAYKNRPEDFKRRILESGIEDRVFMYEREQYWLDMIKETEIKPYNPKPRYYNLNMNTTPPWHAYDDSVKTVGQKISKAKTGKKTGPCSPEKAEKIRQKALERYAKTGGMTEEHKRNVSESKKRNPYKHTDEWKEETSKRLKEEWANGTRVFKTEFTDEYRAKLSAALKGRKISEEQKVKLSKTNSKRYTIEFTDGKVIEIDGLKQYGIDNKIPYVTLFKAAQHNKPIKYLGISKIRLVY